MTIFLLLGMAAAARELFLRQSEAPRQSKSRD
jgi:hypothetical protein